MSCTASLGRGDDAPTYTAHRRFGHTSRPAWPSSASFQRRSPVANQFWTGILAAVNEAVLSSGEAFKALRDAHLSSDDGFLGSRRQVVGALEHLVEDFVRHVGAGPRSQC